MASQVHILAKDIQVLVKKEKIYKFSISRKDIQIISGVEVQESWALGSQSTTLTNSMGPLGAKFLSLFVSAGLAYKSWLKVLLASLV